jgi:hypothetical protein
MSEALSLPLTISVPPAEIVGSATPPPSTTRTPALPMPAPDSAPPEETVSMPPAITCVPLARAPLSTISEPEK